MDEVFLVVRHRQHEHSHGVDGAVPLGRMHAYQQVMGAIGAWNVLGASRHRTLQHLLGLLLGVDGHHPGPASVVGGVEAPDEEEGEVRVCLCDEHGSLVSCIEVML